MNDNKEKFYITTAIAYVNAPPHIGHALELVQADALARYQRARGKEVRFLTGTDEHGTKIVQTAKAQKVSPQTLADTNAQLFKELASSLWVNYDDFIRTSDKKRHWPSVVKIWQKLLISNDLYKKTYAGLYCVGHESFLKESDLVGGLCPDHQTKPELIREENYFFRSSKYTDKVRQLIESEELRIVPQSRRNEILSLLKEGLEDVSFSRPSEKLKWGIPVPGDETQTIYVWADALTNYISSLGYDSGSLDFKKYWPADIQLIGKDILRFHAAIWPAMLISAGIQPPKLLLVHGFITSGGAKMSKTVGNIVDPFALVEKYGSDALRYYLLREIPPTEDGDFTLKRFQERYQADLANGLGNLVARVLTLAQKHPEAIVSGGDFEHVEKKVAEVWENYHKAFDEFKFSLTLEGVWRLIKFCDEYIESERLWELQSKSKERFSQVLTELLLYLAHISTLIEPFLPQAASKIAHSLGIKKESTKSWLEQFKVKKGRPLFPKLERKKGARKS